MGLVTVYARKDLCSLEDKSISTCLISEAKELGEYVTNSSPFTPLIFS